MLAGLWFRFFSWRRRADGGFWFDRPWVDRDPAYLADQRAKVTQVNDLRVLEGYSGCYPLAGLGRTFRRHAVSVRPARAGSTRGAGPVYGTINRVVFD